MNTIVLQSYRANPPPWLQRCMASVRHWAALRAFDYRFVGDSLFERLPVGLRERGDLPHLPLTDLARLGLLREHLAQGYQRVVWIDADVVVFRPELWQLPPNDGALLCYETWTWVDEQGELAATGKINNAVMAFERGHPLLDFLLQSGLRLLLQRAPDRIHPTLLGPMLLSSLGNAVPLDVISQVATLPPILLAGLLDRNQRHHVDSFLRHVPFPLVAANLCRSLLDPHDQRLNDANRVALDDQAMLTIVEGLLSSNGAWLDGGRTVVNQHAGFTTETRY